MRRRTAISLATPLCLVLALGVVAVGAQDGQEACEPRPYRESCVTFNGHNIRDVDLASFPFRPVVSERRETFDGVELGVVVVGRERDGDVIAVEFWGPTVGDLSEAELSEILAVGRGEG